MDDVTTPCEAQSIAKHRETYTRVVGPDVVAQRSTLTSPRPDWLRLVLQRACCARSRDVQLTTCSFLTVHVGCIAAPPPSAQLPTFHTNWWMTCHRRSISVALQVDYRVFIGDIFRWTQSGDPGRVIRLLKAAAYFVHLTAENTACFRFRPFARRLIIQKAAKVVRDLYQIC